MKHGRTRRSQRMKPICLLDIKRLVCDFARAVVDQGQFQAAECWRAEFIFDPSDLHKLLVLKKMTLVLTIKIIQCSLYSGGGQTEALGPRGAR